MNSTQSSAPQNLDGSRLSRRVGCFLFLLALALSTEAAATPASNTGSDISSDRANAAFQCAALAAMGAEDPIHGPSLRSEVDRLFRYGVQQAHISLPEDKVALKKALGDVGPWHEASNMSRDFWIGLFWASANADVEKLIDKETPEDFSTPPFNTASDTQKMRALAAANEFQRRNCGIIGK